jgi:hypothetical protein
MPGVFQKFGIALLAGPDFFVIEKGEVQPVSFKRNLKITVAHEVECFSLAHFSVFYLGRSIFTRIENKGSVAAEPLRKRAPEL